MCRLLCLYAALLQVFTRYKSPDPNLQCPSVALLPCQNGHWCVPDMLLCPLTAPKHPAAPWPSGYTLSGYDKATRGTKNVLKHMHVLMASDERVSSHACVAPSQDISTAPSSHLCPPLLSCYVCGPIYLSPPYFLEQTVDNGCRVAVY